MQIHRALSLEPLTPDLITKIELENFEYLTNNCQLLFSHLQKNKNNKYLLTVDDFKCDPTSGLLPNQAYPACIPTLQNLIYGDIQFDITWLTISDNNAFKQITYQYLPTFSLSSYDELKTFCDSNVSRAYDVLLSEKVNQSRFPSTYAIWRSLFSSLTIVEQIYGDDNFLSKLTATILFRFDTFPFIQTKNGVQYNVTERKKCFSSLPYVIYIINNWCDRLLLGELGITDVKISAGIIDWWISTSLFDSQLKWKGVFTDYLDHVTHTITNWIVREWNSNNLPVRLRKKNVNLNAYATERKLYLEKLSSVPIPWIKELLLQTIKFTKDCNTCRVYGKVIRHLANPGLYLTSIVDITLSDAVDPRLENVLVPLGSKAVTLDNGLTYKVKLDLNTKLGRMIKFMEPFITRAIQSFDANYVQDKAVNFLTPQSGGRKDIPESENIPDKLRKIAGTRLGDALIHHEELGNSTLMLQNAVRAITAGIREQIARRLRAISVISNSKLLLSFVAYVCSLEIIKYLNDASSGKQLGHYNDLSYLLILTGNEKSIVDSIDVSGMDASVQPALYSAFHDMVMQIPSSEKNRFAKYFGFQPIKKNIISENGIEEVFFSGLQLALMTSRESITPFSTKVKGRIFDLQSRDYTFPSGVAFTGTHHTLLLISAIREAEKCWMLKGIPSAISFLNVQGDDILLGYIGDEELSHAQRKFIEDHLSILGFKTTSAASPVLGVFLQQCVIGGSYLGYADRISLCTAERSEWSEDNLDKGEQLAALCADISSRVNNPEILNLIYISYCWWMFSRITLPIDDSKLKIQLPNLPHIRIYKIPNNSGHQNINRFISSYYRFYAPFMMLFHEKGFQAPSLPTIRLDGSVTLLSSYLTPRNEILRRFRIDICGVIDDKFYPEQLAYLEELGFLEADLCVELFKRSTRNQKFKFETFFTNSDVFKYSERLNQFRDANRIANSNLAASNLRLAGIALDDALIEANQIATRIRQIAEDQLPTVNEDVFISTNVLNILFSSSSLLSKKKKLLLGSDAKFNYTLNFSSELINPHPSVDVNVVFNGCSIGPGVTKYSSSGRALIGLGFRSSNSPDLNVQASTNLVSDNPLAYRLDTIEACTFKSGELLDLKPNPINALPEDEYLVTPGPIEQPLKTTFTSTDGCGFINSEFFFRVNKSTSIC
ncbi:MAG: P3 [Corcyphos virus 3]|nr:MAG: P3 [Corcyphos virus 3]